MFPHGGMKLPFRIVESNACPQSCLCHASIPTGEKAFPQSGKAFCPPIGGQFAFSIITMAGGKTPIFHYDCVTIKPETCYDEGLDNPGLLCRLV